MGNKEHQSAGEGNGKKNSITENTKISMTLVGTLLACTVSVCFFLSHIQGSVSKISDNQEALSEKIDSVQVAVESHSDANVASLRQDITANYETAASHNSDIAGVKSTMDKLWTGQAALQVGQAAIGLQIQKLSDSIPNKQN
jgi:hypothetical protein